MGTANAAPGFRRLRAACVCSTLFATIGSAADADLPGGLEQRPPAVPAPAAAQRLTLVLFDVQRQLPMGFEEMAQEVRAIFAEIGVEIAWRQAEPGDTFGDRPGIELPVILLANDPSPARRQRPIMGLVVRDQQPVRSIWAFMCQLKRTLGLDPRPGYLYSGNERRMLSRALARVVAHEVVHALAPEHPHDEQGLMRQTLSRKMLVGTRGALGAEGTRSVLAGLALLAAPPAERSRPAEVTVAGH